MKLFRILFSACAFLLAGSVGSAQQGISDLIVARTVKLTGIVSPSQITSDQNNYAPTSFSTAAILRLSTDASRTLTGLAGGAAGRYIVITNVGSFGLVLAAESSSSTAANRFALANNVTVAASGGTLALFYDGTSSRWRPLVPSASASENALTFSSPLSRSVDTISISNAAADGTTKGAASFTAADFNSSSGLISIDYTNGQAASGSVPGFLSAANWTTFNAKESALTFSTGLTRSTNTITVNAINLAASGSGGVTGILPIANIATGTPNGSKFIRDDGVLATPSGAGNVSGPGSSTDNAITRFDGTSGTTIQNSLITISDAGAFGFTAGVRQSFSPDATNAGLNVGSYAGVPSSLANGDLLYDSTANALKARINGVTVTLGAAGGTETSDTLITAHAPIVWFKATTGVEDTSGHSAADGDSVQYWRDQSGHGYDLTQATSGNRPLYKTSIINSKSVVRFDGSNDYLFASGFPATDLANCTVIVVFKASTSTDFMRIVVIGATGSGEDYTSSARFNVSTGASGDIFGVFGGTSTEFQIDVLGTHSGAWSVATLRVANRYGLMMRNGSYTGLTDLSTSLTTSGTGLLMGCGFTSGAISATSNPLNGDVHEVVVFSPELTDSETGRIVQALRSELAF